MSRQTHSVRLVSDAREAARILVDEIAELAAKRRGQGRSLVLGLATGGTPIAVYEELVSRVAAGRLDTSDFVAFNLDEYCGLTTADPRSFAQWMRARLFDPLAWPAGRTHIPAGDLGPSARARHCAEYEQAIRDAGGIDLQLLGLGRNGHIGFNEPGSSRDSRTRAVDLAPDTRTDAAAQFSPREVPTQALTMGVATILEARRVRLLAFGAHKRPALTRTLGGPAGPDCPASFLLEHGDVQFFADRDALGSYS